jgi:hypothetical protein
MEGTKMRNIGTKARLALVAAVAATLPALAIASETINYSYDAKGRLVKVERSTGGIDKVVTEYEHDKADNRTKVKVTGSPNPPPP